MFLIDTNVWLESILDQQRASEVRDFLTHTEGRLLAITEFSLYSIGNILTRQKKDSDYRDFLSDTMADSGVARIRLELSELEQTLEVRKRYGLDFDDAYQYVAAEKYNLTLVSFDADFDRTELGRKTPTQILEESHHSDAGP